MAIAFFLGLGLVLSLGLKAWSCSVYHPALTHVGIISRGQMAYHLENDKFADKILDLELGIDPDQEEFFGVPLELDMQLEDDIVLATSVYKKTAERCTLYLSDRLPFLRWLGPSCPPKKGVLCLEHKPVVGYTSVTFQEELKPGQSPDDVGFHSGICVNSVLGNIVTVNRQSGEIDCGFQSELME
ncbi:MAG: hypothetical protein AAGG51_24465 [Cyanobacteria bacterium P01_G01_bin.54]